MSDEYYVNLTHQIENSDEWITTLIFMFNSHIFYKIIHLKNRRLNSIFELNNRAEGEGGRFIPDSVFSLHTGQEVSGDDTKLMRRTAAVHSND